MATNLLEDMANRADLPPKFTTELKDRLALRLQGRAPRGPAPEPDMGEAMRQARALAGRGQLDETALLHASQRGEVNLAAALLAVAAHVPASAVERAIQLRSAKAMVSLVWCAGFSMRVAAVLQTQLAHIPPASVLYGKTVGMFPLSDSEMRWQIDFLMQNAR